MSNKKNYKITIIMGSQSDYKTMKLVEKTLKKMNENEINSKESLFSDPEPWESWETALVTWCIGIGIVGLFILGWLVNTLLLS